MIDSQKRLELLRAYEIMDTPPEEAFEDITRLTSYICGTPMAMVSLLDMHRQWFKSSVGIAFDETPIEGAFCARTIEGSEVFVVNDALLDERFASSPLVTGGPNFRFYAGAPLISPEGVALGAVCAVDCAPREFSPAQAAALKALARQVIQILELRRAVKERDTALAAKVAAQAEVAALQELVPMCSWCQKIRNDKSFWLSIENYLAAHSQMRVSHGICPECAEQFNRESGASRGAAEGNLARPPEKAP